MKKISAIVAFLGLGSLIGGYFWAAAEKLVWSPSELACQAKVRWHLNFGNPPNSGRFVILVARLDRDTDGTQTDHVITSLGTEPGFDVIPTCQILRLDRLGMTPVDQRVAAEHDGRALLESWNADLLIWGRVRSADQGLALAFLPRMGQRTTGKPYYPLTEHRVPKGFGKDFAVAMVALAAASASPATELQGKYVASILRRIVPKLKSFAAASSGLSPDQRGRLWNWMGLAAAVLGAQSGEPRWLREAIIAFRSALEVRTRARVPLDWAE